MAFRLPALDLSVAVTTPENICFEYQLAGPFRRLPAMLVDIALRWLFIFGLVVLISFSGLFSVPGFPTLFAFGLYIVMFLLTWFYGLYFETMWNGQTPGKRLMGIRVVSVDGRPINGAQATIRNILRVADFFPFVSSLFFGVERDIPIFPTFLVAFVCMMATRRFQRAGDLAAGTMVVTDERQWVPKKVDLNDERIPQLAEYIPANFQMTRSMAKTIALYMEKRSRMSPACRKQVAQLLAQPLMASFGFRPDTSYDLFLSALYYHEFFTDKEDRSRNEQRRLTNLANSPLIADMLPSLPENMKLDLMNGSPMPKGHAATLVETNL